MPRLVVPFKDKPKKNREELESEVAQFLKNGGKIQHLPTYAESREAEWIFGKKLKLNINAGKNEKLILKNWKRNTRQDEKGWFDID